MSKSKKKPMTEADLKNASRLKHLWNAKKDELGLTQARAADLMGFESQGAVSHYLNGKAALNVSAILKFSTILEIDPKEIRDDLDYGFPPPSLSPLSSPQLKQHSDFITIQQCTDVSGSMGSGIILRDQPGNITSWDVTPEWASKNIPQNTGLKNIRIITGFGDSMHGMFNSGDPLIVDTGITSVEYDAVYFFRVDNEGFIKRLQRVPGRGLVALSENKAYESWAITDEMDFEVFARVLKAWKSEEF